MGIFKLINRARNIAPAIVIKDIPINLKNDIHVMSTGLTAPLTVSRYSGSTNITASIDGAKINFSLSTNLTLGQTQSAVFKVSQADGSFIGIPVTFTGTVSQVITLDALTLTSSTVVENAVSGSIVGAVQNKTTGSVLTLINDAGGRFVLSGNNILVGLTPIDYESTPTLSITIRETSSTASNSPTDTSLVITVIDVNENPSYPADVSTLADIQAILNGSRLITSGSTIKVAPGNYDTRSLTFSAQPSNVRWEAANPNDRPVFTGWKIAPNNFSSSGGHLQFGNINFDMPLPTLGPSGSTTGPIFWSPLPSSIHSIILGEGSSLDALTIEDFDTTGNMLPWHLGGRMTHNNPFVSLSGAKNVTIRRGTIRRNRSGVEINGVSGIIIEDVHFTEQHADPIVLQNGTNHLENVIIRNNHFTLPSGDTANHHSDGIQLQPISGPYQIRNVDIQGNTISALVPVMCAQLDPTHTQVFPSLQGVSAAGGNTTVTLPTNPANGTIWAYMRTDATLNSCVVAPGGTNTLSTGATQSLVQNNVVLFVFNSTTGQWVVETTGQAFGPLIADRWHAQELRLSIGTDSFSIDLPPASNGARQYLFRCNSAGGGTVTFTLSGSDTYSEGVLPIVTTAGQAPTFVSNGSNQWRPLPLGYRSWFVQRTSSFVLGQNEVSLVTKLNASNNDVIATLPLNGSGVYHIGREDGSSNICKIVTSGSNTITYNGSSVTEIPFVQGYGIDITGNGSGGWSVIEQTPTYTFTFGNSGDYTNFRCYGNIGLVFGDFYRPEVAFKQSVFNNTVLRLVLDDINGDGIVGRYENNSGSQQNVIQLSGSDAYGERNFGTGYIALGGYGPYGGGAAVPGKIKNNLMLATADNTDVVSALSAYLNGTNRAFYRPLSRSEVVAVARAKSGGPLDGTFIGASGKDDTDGFYNFSTGQINSNILPRPIVETTSPLIGATIGLDQSFQFTFDKFIKAGTGNITLWNATDNTLVESFNVETGVGSFGGSVTFSIDGFVLDPFSNLISGKTYHIRISSTAIVGQSYNNTFIGTTDGTFHFVADAGVATAYTTLTADKGAYLTRTGALNTNGAIKKAVFAFEARLVPNANSIHSIFGIDRTQDFNVAIVQSNGELRMTYGSSSWRVASAVPVSGTTRKRIIVVIDTTQSTIADGVKVYIDGSLATLVNTVWVQDTALVGTDAATITRAVFGANSVFNGELAFIYFNALDTASALPDISSGIVRAKFDPGQIGPNGEGPTGTIPLFYKTGGRTDWENASNLGSLTGFTKVGSFL